MDSHTPTPPLEAIFNIGAVSRMTGIPVATLHAWERRYAFPRLPERTIGGHRLYSAKDIILLRSVKAQVEQGLSARQAVAAVQRMDLEGRLLLDHPVTSQTLPTDATIPTGPLLEALLRHDLEQADRLMGEMLAFFTPEELTVKLIGPTLNAIGEAWEHGRISVATEHLASNYLRHRLLMWLVTGPRLKQVNPVVLACAPDEWHEGSLLILAVFLRRRGWPVAYLGQNVPFIDLANYARQNQASAIVLVAMMEETARGLVDWPAWIQQTSGRPQVMYGGRAFVVHPELQKQVPGTYLGDDIQAGFSKITAFLQGQPSVLP